MVKCTLFDTEGSKGNDLLYRNWNREKATHAIPLQFLTVKGVKAPPSSNPKEKIERCVDMRLFLW